MADRADRRHRLSTDLVRFERALREQGFSRVAGADEAGRGALAGPLVAAAVMLPDGFDPEGIDDSKVLSRPQREAAYERIVAVATYAVAVSVAAASIVAKVTRDRIMVRMHRRYPEFGFDHNVGYGTPEHLEVLDRLGPTPIHRLSFACVGQPLLPGMDRSVGAHGWGPPLHETMTP